MKRKRVGLETKILGWYTHQDVFGKISKSKTFKKAYSEELARLKLAATIKKTREEKKMTQAAVANKINMPQSVIARLESGSHGVSVDTLSRVAHALGKQVELV